MDLFKIPTSVGISHTTSVLASSRLQELPAALELQRVVRSIISPAGGLRDRVGVFSGREYAKGIAEEKKKPLKC